jgi:hypothetical protein
MPTVKTVSTGRFDGNHERSGAVKSLNVDLKSMAGDTQRDPAGLYHWKFYTATIWNSQDYPEEQEYSLDGYRGADVYHTIYYYRKKKGNGEWPR